MFFSSLNLAKETTLCYDEYDEYMLNDAVVVMLLVKDEQIYINLLCFMTIKYYGVGGIREF